MLSGIKIFCFLMALSSITTHHDAEGTPKRIQIEHDSKIVLGGLFPVHSKGTSEEGRCGQILTEKGIQRLEAMLYALDQINNDPSNWPFKFGATILDTCTSDSYALEQSLQFLHYTCGQNANVSNKITAVVGASNSDVSESLANIFRLFHIPQVSYASTSEELDDMYKYSYFFRVVPSDRFQVRVILDILLKMRWTYVSVVSAKGEYGERAAKNLKLIIGNSTHEEICIATSVVLKRGAQDADYDTAVSRLDREYRAKVVVVFLNEDKIGMLLGACDRSGLPENRFLWLGSDGWGAKIRVVRDRDAWAKESITIMPKRFPIKGFDDYFLSLKPALNTRNPWFKEFWESQFRCKFKKRREETIRICTGNEDLRHKYHQEGLVPMVIDSVYLLATAIRTLCHMDDLHACKNSGNLDQHHRNKLVEIIANVSMNSSQGNGIVISFDKTRSIPVNYTIFQYQEAKDETFAYEPIGEWNPYENLTLFKSPSWSFKDDRDAKGRPKSSCSDECKPGHERLRSQQRKRCCWECRGCTENKYLPAADEPCRECPIGKKSNPDKTGCNDIEIDYVGKDMRNPWAVIPLVFSVFGLIITCVVFVIFFLHHKTPIIMASGRELCYVILVGIMFCYFFPFIVLLKPTKVSCGILRIGMGLGLSICYSAIFTKTNRISRIFEVSMKITKRPSYISPGSQVIICVCLVLIQVTLTVLWLIVNPPEVLSKFLRIPNKWVEVCDLDDVSVVLGLLYNMILLILCTIYAYKTRHIPENFNETKWISFTMYSSCIVWLAFIPIYCGALQEYKVQSIVLSMSVSVSGTVTLVCIFFPKIYIVLFHPERNVRYPSSSATSGTGTCDSQQPVRFLRTVPNNIGAVHQSPISKTESPFHFLQKPASKSTTNSF